MADGNGRQTLASMVQAKRRNGGGGGGDGRVAIDDAEAYPRLTELLTVLPPGAKGTKPGRVAIFVQDGRLTLCASYPSLVAVAFFAADGFQDALTRLEGALEAGTLEWREDKQKAR